MRRDTNLSPDHHVYVLVQDRTGENEISAVARDLSETARNGASLKSVKTHRRAGEQAHRERPGALAIVRAVPRSFRFPHETASEYGEDGEGNKIAYL